MDGLQFEWDPAKASSNRRKHGVTFEEAATVWDDVNRVIEPDFVHSTDDEFRELALGIPAKFRVLLVIFTARHEAIRIISARRATKAEARRYAE